MKQFLGKGGLLEKINFAIDSIIDLYVKMFNQEGTADYDLDENPDRTITVTFERRSCACCPGDEVGRFYISQAMLDNPRVELEKLKLARGQEQAAKAEVRKHKEALAKRREKRKRKKLYGELQEEFKK